MHKGVGARPPQPLQLPPWITVSHTRFRLALFLACMLSAVSAAAQTPILDPNFVEFNASTDHQAVDGTGGPLVTRYDLEFYLIGASAPFQTANLGKPAPNGSGIISLSLATTDRKSVV